MKHLMAESSKNQILIGGLLCASSPFLCKKTKEIYSYNLSVNLHKTPTTCQICVVFQMKLNQLKGFIQINKSPLHQNVLPLLSWTGKSADYHFVWPVIC